MTDGEPLSGETTGPRHDDAFHLTPLDVRRMGFPVAIRGYDRARVDDFREQVAGELERLARQGQEFESKARSFHEQLRAFRDRDRALNEALVSAQQLRAEIREQAEREGKLVIREARAEAERLVDAAKAEIRRLTDEVAALERAKRSYLAQFRETVIKQLTELDAIAQHANAPPSSPAPPTPAAPAASPARGK